jgi:hypothetical protein
MEGVKTGLDKREFDNIPVVWCGNCHSLGILSCADIVCDGELCFCKECGSTDVREGSIYEWLVDAPLEKRVDRIWVRESEDMQDHVDYL